MAAGGNWKEMFHAAEQGDYELVRYHLNMGVDPNYQHPEYMTGALLESIRKGHLDIARLLLEKNANPSMVKVSGTETPLSIAIAQHNKAAIYLLQEYLPKKEQTQLFGTRNTILITGGNQGIGKALAKNLLLEGQNVVLTVRKEAEGQAIIEELKVTTKNPNISFLQGDLSTIQGCQQLVTAIKKEHPDLTVLINHAEVWMTEKEVNKEGLEKSFMVNYLAPYLLSKGLIDTLKKNAPARIINSNAAGYQKGKFAPKKTPYGLDFNQQKTYATSKLCTAMFTIDFAKALEGSGVTINTIYPGRIQTHLSNPSNPFIKFFKRFWQSPEQGAAVLSWLALAEQPNEVNGVYYHKKEPIPYTGAATNASIRQILGEYTQHLVNQHSIVNS